MSSTRYIGGVNGESYGIYVSDV